MNTNRSSGLIERLAWRLLGVSWALINVTILMFLGGVVQGRFFKITTKEEKAELEAARNRYWSLDREPLPGFRHSFCTLRNGLKLHYVVNDRGVEQVKNVAVFLHGFPDSFLLWRHLLTEETLQNYLLIAVDLPGYGGSDSLSTYDANQVLETVTEFILAMRAQYLKEEHKFIIVSHDWGGLIAARLASEANQLADRFVIAAAVIPQHAYSNAVTKYISALQMLHTYFQRPWKNFSLLKNAYRTVKPILSQIRRSFYVFCFNLPYPLPTVFTTFGSFWFLNVVHKSELGLLKPDGQWEREMSVKEAADFLAMSAGPGTSQTTDVGGQYPEAVKRRLSDHGMSEKIRFYREGLFGGIWEKSIETVVALSEIPPSQFRFGSSSSDDLFDSGPPGKLKAPATILYGRNDVGFDRRLALDGISDSISGNSQVVFLDNSGHWLPYEKESRVVLKSIVEWALGDERSALKEKLASESVTLLVDQ
ncbi:alpha/beta-hydrolase [Periconia macrospinosa]|uniref:Alpha/beta-hydrolase n=1 Tax=Periconia macrospinosa TaxID=97972 RepID=A0A2V1DZW6_9PLEO|nr:alpha/beta-hydrolase [Periconia macrospinosa]